MIRHALWLAWLVALAVGANAAIQYGTRGSWYVSFSVGCCIGMATWVRRPGRKTAGVR